jgi:hypothetical protein
MPNAINHLPVPPHWWNTWIVPLRDLHLCHLFIAFFILSPLSRSVLIASSKGEILSCFLNNVAFRSPSGPGHPVSRIVGEAGGLWGVGCAQNTKPRSSRVKSSIEHASCYTARLGSAMLAPHKALRRTDALGARKTKREGLVAQIVGVKEWSSMRARSGPYRSHWLCGLHDPLSFAEGLLVKSWSVGVISQIGSNRVPTQEKRKEKNQQLTVGDQRSAIAEGSLVDLIQ